MRNKINKKAQVTIFIIIALIIIVAIVLIFSLFRKPVIGVSAEEDPQAYIEKCARDVVSDSIEKVIVGGGRVTPEFYKLYQGEQYNYLCYQKNYYLTCINQYPMLKSIAEEEIEKDIAEEIVQCFDSLKTDLEKKGFSVSEESLDYEIKIIPHKVIIEIKKKVDVVKGDSRSFTNFEAQALSPLYELIMIARQIVNHEAQYCNFEYNGFMILYPEYDIKRFGYDESRLYRVIDRLSEKEFKFAIRSCALPPGF